MRVREVMQATLLEERLENFPQLKERFVQLLEIVENTGGCIKLADDAEEMVINVGRDLTRETLEIWANKRAVRSCP